MRTLAWWATVQLDHQSQMILLVFRLIKCHVYQINKQTVKDIPDGDVFRVWMEIERERWTKEEDFQDRYQCVRIEDDRVDYPQSKRPSPKWHLYGSSDTSKSKMYVRKSMKYLREPDENMERVLMRQSEKPLQLASSPVCTRIGPKPDAIIPKRKNLILFNLSTRGSESRRNVENT